MADAAPNPHVGPSQSAVQSLDQSTELGDPQTDVTLGLGSAASLLPSHSTHGDGDADAPVTDWSDRAMARMVPLAPATLGATMTCLSLAHLTSIDSLAGSYLSMASGTAGLALATSSLLWRRHRMGRHPLHAIMSGCLVLAGLDTLAFARLTFSLERTADLMLLVVACGLVLIDRRWHRATLGVLLAGWGSLAVNSGAFRPYQVVALLLATALGASVRRARLASLHEVQELQATASLAVLDPLTGLPDRRGVQLVAAHLLAIARRESGAVGCTFVGVPGYDEVRGTAGAEAADALVLHVAGVIGSVVRGTDVVARWSTSHFVVVTHGPGAPMDVLEDRIARILGAGCPVPDAVWTPRLLLGRAVLEPWDDGGLATTLEAAERDMYLRAGLEPPRASADAYAEAAAAHSLQVQAAQGEAVSEMITGVDAVLTEAARTQPAPAATTPAEESEESDESEESEESETTEPAQDIVEAGRPAAAAPATDEALDPLQQLEELLRLGSLPEFDPPGPDLPPSRTLDLTIDLPNDPEDPDF